MEVGAAGAVAGAVVSEQFTAAVAQCLFVTLAGYAAGRLGVLSPAGSRGLERFVGQFALPALVFRALATLNFGVVDWRLLGALVFTKSLLFVLVFCVTLALARATTTGSSDSSMGKAAIYAVFTTQSNDFAIGYSVLSAIFANTHPHFVDYLYLVAPVSLAILNPIAFYCLELERQQWRQRRQLGAGGASAATLFAAGGGRVAPALRVMARSAVRVAANPVVAMTAAGVAANVARQGAPLPPLVRALFEPFSAAFSATALFMLGLRLAHSPEEEASAGPPQYGVEAPPPPQRQSLVVPVSLIVVKSLVTPLLARQTVGALLAAAGADSDRVAALTNFTFLYGLLPTAPSVLVYATQYGVQVHTVARALVLGTFLSAPLIFVAAWVMTVFPTVAPSTYVGYVRVYLTDMSVLGLASGLWVLALFTLSGKLRRLPFTITYCLLLSQILACVGAIIVNRQTLADAASSGSGGVESSDPLMFVRLLPLVAGVLSSRVWTALLAVAMVTLQRHSEARVRRLRVVGVAVGWLFPTALASVLLVASDGWLVTPTRSGDPNFVLGLYQSVPATVVLTVSLAITVACIVQHHRLSNQSPPPPPPPPAAAAAASQGQLPWQSSVSTSDTDTFASPTSLSPAPHPPAAALSTVAVTAEGLAGAASSSSDSDSELHDADEELKNLLTANQWSPPPLPQLHFGWNDSGAELRRQTVEARQQHQQQVERHMTLLLFLSVSMLVGLCLSLWNILTDTMVGAYAVLDLIDGALNLGQSFFVFMLFGIDDDLMVAPLVRWWRRLKSWCRATDSAGRPVEPSQLPDATRRVCRQFCAYHAPLCRRQLVPAAAVAATAAGGAGFADCFSGQQLVSWLVHVGLAGDGRAAAEYGRRLLEGGVLRHCRRGHQLHDSAHALYQLVDTVDWQLFDDVTLDGQTG